MLYITTGEGFVASRAADPNNLSGKILRLNLDGSGESTFAWGFRNPQGLAFDSKGRLYASNNGPSGDLGLCCHDSLYLVAQGGFALGWRPYPCSGPRAWRLPLDGEQQPGRARVSACRR